MNLTYTLQSYPDKEELLRNMMGLLGNVAEVKHLRPIFMSDMLITEFVELLDSQSDGIEVIRIHFSKLFKYVR